MNADKKKVEALAEVTRLGRLCAKGGAAMANAFDCSPSEAADQFENACQNARHNCEVLGITETEEMDAWNAGYRRVSK